MFDQMKMMSSLMKNAGQIKEKVEQFKVDLEKRHVEGESGGGAVRVTINGKGRTLRVHIDEPLMAGLAGDDKSMVEDLIAAAFNNARDKLDDVVAEELRKATGGLDLPGMENLLG